MPALDVDHDRTTHLWRWYRPAVWCFALAGFAVWTAAAPALTTRDAVTVAVLVVFANIADLAGVSVQPGMRVSAVHFAAPFALIAASPMAGIVAGLGSFAGRAVFNRRDWRSFDVAVNMLATSVAGSMWQLTTRLGQDAVIIPSVLTVLTFTATRSLINLGWAAEARAAGHRIPRVTARIGRLMMATAMLLTPAIALFTIARPGLLESATLLALPFVASQFMVRQYGRERSLNVEIEAANLSLTESLVNALDARDPYSAGHSQAVAVYARDLAAYIGLDEATVQETYLAGLLHDIGKIAVPDAILRKPAALTDAEFAEIHAHPGVGAQILAPSQHLRAVLPGVRHHHERIDGRGYPDQLRDAEIPLVARIIAVADAYDAMTSSRPYRDAMHPELARRVLVQNQGMQHDPFLVAAFRRLLDERGSDYAHRRGADFASSNEVRDLVDGAHARWTPDAA